MRWEHKSFEAAVNYVKKHDKGSVYERKKGLQPRCHYGKLWQPDFGTITSITSDNQISLWYCFRIGKKGTNWFLWMPSDEQFDYIIKDAKKHIAAIYDNNLSPEKADRVLYRKTGENMGSIDWNRFQGKYLKVDVGKQHRVALANWRQEQKRYGESTEDKTALVFDVVMIDGVSYVEQPLEWATTSGSLAFEFKPVIERAEAAGKKVINIILKRKTQQEYTFVEPGEMNQDETFPF
jgi:hypothetical protein